MATWRKVIVSGSNASLGALALGGVAVTSTAAELNILDGVTSTAAELNILDGVTSTAAELNALDGITSNVDELNALDGITAVVGELNALDIGSTAVGTAVASKAVILDSNKDYTGIRNLTVSGELDAATGDFSGAVDIAGDLTLSAGADGALTFGAASSIKIVDNQAASLVIEEADVAYMTFKTTDSSELITANKGFNAAGAFQIGGTAVTSTAAELNLVDGSSAGSIVNSKAVIYSSGGQVNGTSLAIGGTAITSTAAELNALDGITAVVGELNALDIGSTAVGTAVASKAVILDSNKDYTGIRNLTVSGELDAATGDFSGDVDIAGTLVVQGDLSVTGDLTNVNTANLNVEDQFILLNSGSINTDVGIIFGGTHGTVNTGKALVWDHAANHGGGADGRLAVKTTATATDIANDANAFAAGTTGYYLAGVFRGSTDDAATALADHEGNIRIENDELFMYF